jgi:hypothetical protein
MTSGMLTATDPVLGIQLSEPKSIRVFNRAGGALAVGETLCLDIQMQATETVNWIVGDPGSVWANAVLARDNRDFDDKPWLVVDSGDLTDHGLFKGYLWHVEIPVLLQARTQAPGPDPVRAGIPMCAPIGAPLSRNLRAQQANYNSDGPHPTWGALPPGRARDQGAKYTGYSWESIAHDLVENRLCLFNGWTGFGTVSFSNP